MVFARRLCAEWMRLAFKGKSAYEQTVKALMWAVAIIPGTTSIFIQTIVPLPLGFVISALVVTCILVAAFVLAWSTVPQLTFESEPPARPIPWEDHYSIALRNTSSIKRIKKPQVMWTASDPPVHHMPVSLHRMHDVFDDPKHPDLPPRQRAVFDVVRLNKSTNFWELMDDKKPFVIPRARYTVTLEATGEDIHPSIQTVIVEPGSDRRPVMYLERRTRHERA